MEQIKDRVDNEVLHKEIDLVQACINRMANNSFLLKGWLVSIIVVILALLPEKINGVAIGILTTIIILIFWYLDSIFLMLEKLYRKKYEWIIKERLEGNKLYLYDLNPYNKNMWLSYDKKDTSILASMFSKTIVLFYIVPAIISILTTIIIYN